MSEKNYIAYALVKNFHSSEKQLGFDNFSLEQIVQGDGESLDNARHLFAYTGVEFGDWIYKRVYPTAPFGHPGNHTPISIAPWGDIPFEIEDTLLLLRLYKRGDLIFTRIAIEKPDGTISLQCPYRVISDYDSSRIYRMELEDCPKWSQFAMEMLNNPNWHSEWFKTAKRFFLYGGAKQFSPWFDEVDRVVDYMIAIESILVPEGDFVSRRARERSFEILQAVEHNRRDKTSTIRLLKTFYSVRSTIAHGGALGQSDKEQLETATEQLEQIVRDILIAAVRQLPIEDGPRKAFLHTLYDVSDEDRGDYLIGKFKEVHTEEEKKRVLSELKILV